MQKKKLIKSVGKYIRMSPTKVHRILDQIRGRSYKEGLMILEYLPYRACTPIWKVLHSAGANAENNFSLNKQTLFIQQAFGDQGPTLKRLRLRAKGKSNQIRKLTCHITIILGSNQLLMKEDN
jgi:large subunit ribosomal protein L22